MAVDLSGWKNGLAWDDFTVTRQKGVVSEAWIVMGFKFSTSKITADLLTYDETAKAYKLTGFSVQPDYGERGAVLAEDIKSARKRFLLIHERVHHAIFRHHAYQLSESLNKLSHKSDKESAKAAEAALKVLAPGAIKLLASARSDANKMNTTYENTTRPKQKGVHGDIEPKAQLTWTAKIRKLAESGLTEEDEAGVQTFINSTTGSLSKNSETKYASLDKHERPALQGSYPGRSSGGVCCRSIG